MNTCRIFLVSCIFCILSAITLAGTYSGGNGDPNNPYQIANGADLYEMTIQSGDWDRHFIMIADVNMVGYEYDHALIDSFAGVFDGAGYVISNITLDTGGGGWGDLGFFGQINDADVKNLGIENVTVIGGECSDNIGGLCGYNNGTITNCHATGSVTGGSSLGGLCGSSYEGTISNCYATGSVTGSSKLGGLCGRNFNGTISNCYATGSVTGDSNLGGLCGSNYGTISNCYTTGVGTGRTGANWLGGLCGSNYETISDCYFLNTAGPNNGLGTPLTDALMKKQSSYSDWDFVNDANGDEDIWRMCSDNVDYPKLWYQFTPGDIACPNGVDLTDLTILASEWLTNENNPDFYDNADLNDDGQIDIVDFSILSSNWLR